MPCFQVLKSLPRAVLAQLLSWSENEGMYIDSTAQYKG